MIRGNPGERGNALIGIDELLRATGRGDASAFRVLYQETAAHLFSVAMRILHRRDKAEEALQDAFINVWRRAADWQPERGSARTWLTSIVHHRAIDLVRREGRLQPFDDEYLELPDPGPDATAHVAAAEDRLRLERCMADLDPTAQRALRLAYRHGLTHDQLAHRLNVPIGTIKSWVRRGLIRLRGCLDS